MKWIYAQKSNQFFYHISSARNARTEEHYDVSMIVYRNAMNSWWFFFLALLLGKVPSQKYDSYHFAAIHHFPPSRRSKQKISFWYLFVYVRKMLPVKCHWFSYKSGFCWRKYFVCVNVYIYWHLWRSTDIKWLNFFFSSNGALAFHLFLRLFYILLFMSLSLCFVNSCLNK